MGRRRRRARESAAEGVLGDAVDAILMLAKASSVAGFVLCAGFCGLGVYLMTVGKTLLYSFAPVFGVCAVFLGVLCGICGLTALIRRSAATGRTVRALFEGLAPGRPGPTSAPSPLPQEQVERAPARVEAITPVCRSCGVPMVRRVAGSGPKAGRPFWGCGNFPRCREVVDIA